MPKQLNVRMRIQIVHFLRTNGPIVGGPVIFPFTINHFIRAATSGKMPGGVQTSQPLFPEKYIQQFSTKYVEWAPPPFDKLPPPALQMGSINMGSMPGDSPAAIIRVMHVISGIDRMFSSLSLNPGQNMGLSAKAMRSRVRLPSVLEHENT